MLFMHALSALQSVLICSNLCVLGNIKHQKLPLSLLKGQNNNKNNLYSFLLEGLCPVTFSYNLLKPLLFTLQCVFKYLHGSE